MTEKRVRPVRDVRKYRGMDRNWEDVTTDEGAERDYAVLKKELSKMGINIQDPSCAVLEIGTGLGKFLKLMHEDGVNAVGVDARPRGYTERTQQAEIEHLPFRKGAFHVVVGTSVFDPDVYEQDTGKMAQEIARVLKKNGVFVHMGVAAPINDVHLERVNNNAYFQMFSKNSRTST